MYNSVNTFKATELYTLNWVNCTVWEVYLNKAI